MKSRFFAFFFVVTFMVMAFAPHKASAQGLKIIASNTALGALEGAMLGGASMALANNDDWRPMRFGIGFGTIAGLGFGIYDVSQHNSGSRPVRGVFNQANYTTQIIVQDTFYGAVIGSLVGMAVTLILDEKVIYGLQYGVGVGTWAGFAFGLVDVFAIDQGVREYRYEDFDDYSSSSMQQSGILQMQLSHSHSLGFGDLTFTHHPDFESDTNRSALVPVVTVASWQVRF